MYRPKFKWIVTASLLSLALLAGEVAAQQVVLFTHPRVSLSTNPATPTTVSVWCIGCNANTTISYTTGGNTWTGVWTGHGSYILHPGYFPDLITMTHTSGDPSNVPSIGVGTFTTNQNPTDYGYQTVE